MRNGAAGAPCSARLSCPPMHLALFGGTGRTGRHVLSLALDAGHTVTALARRPSALPPRPGLAVVAGSVTDAAAVVRTVGGADAVVMALGPTKTSPPDVMTVAARHVVDAMTAAGVRRVVSLTGAGVADPRDPGGAGPAFMRGVMRLVAAGLLRDGAGHLDALRASGLDWTLVRAPRLTDGPPTGRYRTGYLAMGPAHAVARADVAAYLVHLAVDGSETGGAPMITSRI